MVSLPSVFSVHSFNTSEWGVEQRGVAVLRTPTWRQWWSLFGPIFILHLEGWRLRLGFGLGFRRRVELDLGNWGHVIEDPVVEIDERGLVGERGLLGGWWACIWVGCLSLKGGDAGLDGGRRHTLWGVLGSRSTLHSLRFQTPHLSILIHPCPTSTPSQACSPSLPSYHLLYPFFRLLPHSHGHRRALCPLTSLPASRLPLTHPYLGRRIHCRVPSRP